MTTQQQMHVVCAIVIVESLKQLACRFVYHTTDVVPCCCMHCAGQVLVPKGAESKQSMVTRLHGYDDLTK